ncbi:MAG: hypothetical protein HY543_00910 [Deltaproteobacteria bacterium]|nr:hypothetical protein [Deltaproteobacteria bacterium]
MLADGEIDCRRQRTQAKKPATLSGLVVIVVAGIGMTMARTVVVDVVRADAMMVVGQAMRRCGISAESRDGARRRQT